MNDDPLKWAAQFRARAAESTKRADDAIDPVIEAYYRSLVGRYLKLAEAEEEAAALLKVKNPDARAATRVIED